MTVLTALIPVGALVFVIAVVVFALRNGGLRLRDGTFIGRPETQQEFDEKIARLEAKDRQRQEWLDRH